ncbi:MAG: glycosyltransferase family 4 protein [Bacteroidia bacterium]|nr:glycosyltransferase family 4 protein [Bacteroidia bacterium]
MKLFILTQYFPPEVGAPQNRLFELAIHLKNRGVDVSVLTAMPNYPQMQVYEGYKGTFYWHEEIDGLKVHRAWIYVTTKRSVFPRLLNYFSFVFTSFFVGLFKLGKQDYILCESPPLFLGISAYLLKKVKGAKLIFNVSDLWPESAEKLGLVTNKTLLKLSTKLEEFLYRKSELITGQTKGIVNNIASRFPGKKVTWIPNGVDLNFYNFKAVHTNWRKDNNFSGNDFILMYAGIIGHAQGLEVIIRAAARLKDQIGIKFVLVGNGPEKEGLIKMKNESAIPNVYFFDVVNKDQMPPIVLSIDAAIIPLKRLDLFKGAIPSKIFETLAMKKPILLGVEGEAKELFIDEGKSGLAFEPENDIDLSEKILELYNNRQKVIEFGENGFRYVEQQFTRARIAGDLFELLKTNLKN